MALLELDRVRKIYGTTVAVDDLSLSLAGGRIFGLLGANGAGKTTAIRLMVGIIIPDAGSIRIFGQPFERRHLRAIGYIPEERGLYRKLRVEQLLLYFGGLRGLDRATAGLRAEQLAERFGMRKWLSRRVEELSNGMQQKVQFIAALIHNPQVLIMDEPFAGLDPLNSSLTMDLLLELKRAGRAILLSSHRLDHIEKLCDEICILNRGRATAQGSLAAIRARFGQRRQPRVLPPGATTNLNRPQVARVFNGCAAGRREGNLPEPADDAAIERPPATAGAGRKLDDEAELSLEEIFIRLAGGDGGR